MFIDLMRLIRAEERFLTQAFVNRSIERLQRLLSNPPLAEKLAKIKARIAEDELTLPEWGIIKRERPNNMAVDKFRNILASQAAWVGHNIKPLTDHDHDLYILSLCLLKPIDIRAASASDLTRIEAVLRDIELLIKDEELPLQLGVHFITARVGRVVIGLEIYNKMIRAHDEDEAIVEIINSRKAYDRILALLAERVVANDYGVQYTMEKLAMNGILVAIN